MTPAKLGLDDAELARLMPPNKHLFRVQVYTTLLILDWAAILFSFMIGNVIAGKAVFAKIGMDVVVILIPFYLLTALQSGVYGVAFFRQWRKTTERAIGLFLLATLATIFVGFYFRSNSRFSREIFTIGMMLSAGLIVLTRYLVHLWTEWRMDGEPLTEALICDEVVMPPGTSRLMLSAQALNLSPNIDDPQSLDRIGQLLHRLERVVIACPEERRSVWTTILKGANVRGEIVSPEISALGVLGADTFHGMATLLVSVGPLDTRSRVLKRALDIALACTACVILLPLFIVVAVAVKFDSHGPILFSQPRLGRNNRIFQVLKFRSMASASTDFSGHMSTMRDDRRITRVGRLIRATSIDELPQILNVLRGEMSIVGPRPHALGSLAGDKLFWEIDSRYWHRHCVKPGITGLAQVRGFRGATVLGSDLSDRLQADLDYLHAWTLWRDIRIILATLRVILHHNAY